MSGVHTFTVVPALPEELEDLDFIARNMYWCWNLEFVGLFNRIDSRLWKTYSHNPIKLLGGVSQERLNELASNRGFVSQVKREASEARFLSYRPKLVREKLCLFGKTSCRIF